MPTTDSAYTACAVIPVYNHEHAIARVVEAVRAAGLPCILVDDGSGAACARELDRLAVASDVALVRLASNGGKGAAVMAGLRESRVRGYTHALQIDADGQHTFRDIPRFLTESRAHPGAVICGRPIFDESIPKVRLCSRYITHTLVWMSTLSYDIRDSMCGFRLYPLAPVLALMDSERLGTRMDFDVELLVHLHWRGVELRWLATRVSYPLDGVSHYRLVLDNIGMARMHARLLAGMVVRSPRILARKLSPGRASP